jgi:XTP/dITP diphosphohydrolase
MKLKLLFRKLTLKSTPYLREYGMNHRGRFGPGILALNGEPGIYSARYGGTRENHEKNNKLLEAPWRENESNAQRWSAITLIHTNEEAQFEWNCERKKCWIIIPQDGFGYYPLFTPRSYDRTFAEMTMEEKTPLVEVYGRAVIVCIYRSFN